MIYRLLAYFLAFVLAASCGTASGQPAGDQPSPPIRLRKKHKPAPPPVPSDRKSEAGSKDASANKEHEKDAKKKTKPSPKPQEAKEDEESAEKDAAQEAKEALARVVKGMRASEERLAKKDTGEGTRQIQRDILNDLDRLIKQTQRQQQQQQSSSSSSSSSRRNQPAQKAQQSRQQRARRGQKPKPGTQPNQQTARNRQNGRGSSQRTKEAMSKIADLYKDVWGHLPETLRQEMDQYSREQFMAKYGDLLKQYYATIAEKGRRKGE